MSFPCLELAGGFHGNQNKCKLPQHQPTGSPLWPHPIFTVPHLLCEQAKSFPMPPALAFELAVSTGHKFLFLPPAQGAPECVRLQTCPQSWPLVFVPSVIHTPLVYLLIT